MIQCPICLKEVASFKTNSHVLPRWALSHIKTNGQNILITPKGAANNQEDFAGDYMCEHCEAATAKDDGVAASVIRDQKTLLNSYINEGTGVEIHDPSNGPKFVKFSLGVLLRTHLYKLALNEGNLLGPYFEKLRKMYLGESPQCKVLICRDGDLKLCSLPQKQTFGESTTQEFVILGYRVAHFLKEKNIPEHFNQFFVNETNFNIMIDNRKASHWYRGLAAHVQQVPFPRR